MWHEMSRKITTENAIQFASFPFVFRSFYYVCMFVCCASAVSTSCVLMSCRRCCCCCFSTLTAKHTKILFSFQREQKLMVAQFTLFLFLFLRFLHCMLLYRKNIVKNILIENRTHCKCLFSVSMLLSPSISATSVIFLCP